MEEKIERNVKIDQQSIGTGHRKQAFSAVQLMNYETWILEREITN